MFCEIVSKHTQKIVELRRVRIFYIVAIETESNDLIIIVREIFCIAKTNESNSTNRRIDDDFVILNDCDKIVTAMKIRMNDNVNINAIDLYRDEFKLKYDVFRYR